MMNRRTDHQRMFGGVNFDAVELFAADIPALQKFFDDNPDYFIAVTGAAPRSNEGFEEFHDQVPADMSFTKKWLLGFYDEADNMIGMASVVSDLIAKNVWHVGLFVIATSLHGRGTARIIYDALEQWMCVSGATWIRLGVVDGNARAERFWEKCGYRDVRKRHGVEMGAKINSLRVMVKSLGAESLDRYLAQVVRDRPE